MPMDQVCIGSRQSSCRRVAIISQPAGEVARSSASAAHPVRPGVRIAASAKLVPIGIASVLGSPGQETSARPLSTAARGNHSRWASTVMLAVDRAKSFDRRDPHAQSVRAVCRATRVASGQRS